MTLTGSLRARSLAWLAGAAATLGLVGCGSSSGSHTTTTSRLNAPHPHGVLIAGASCQPSSHRHPTCTVLLTDASRYRCALTASHHLSGSQIAANTHCIPLVPLRIPKAWKPVLEKLAVARICLREHGLKVLGGASVTAVPPHDSPVGAVVVSGRPAGIVVTWYWTAEGAKRVETAFTRSKPAGRLARKGQVTVSWLFPKLLPKGRLATVEGCAFA